MPGDQRITREHWQQNVLSQPDGRQCVLKPDRRTVVDRFAAESEDTSFVGQQHRQNKDQRNKWPRRLLEVAGVIGFGIRCSLTHTGTGIVKAISSHTDNISSSPRLRC